MSGKILLWCVKGVRINGHKETFMKTSMLIANFYSVDAVEKSKKNKKRINQKQALKTKYLAKRQKERKSDMDKGASAGDIEAPADVAAPPVRFSKDRKRSRI